MMLSLLIVSALNALPVAQQPAPEPHEQVAALKAGLGACSADFIVNDMEGNPVYAATVHVRVRYGMLGIKRADLEVGTNADGKARIEGLPTKAKPLMYEIRQDGRKAVLVQDVARNCRATYTVTLR